MPFPTPDPSVGTLDYGSYPAPVLLTPGTFNPSTETVNAVGIVSALGAGAGTSGPAGGDLSGTYPNPTVIATHLSAPLPILQGGTAAVGLADSEIPTGAINGSNKNFTLAHTPQSAAILHVFADGLRTTAFGLAGTALTMTNAPNTSLLVDYRY